MAHDVFITYAAEDKLTADAVCATLEARRIRCWIAPRDILPGMDYAQAVVEAISESCLVVLIFSTHSNHSPHVRREVERAVSRGTAIIPFRIEDVSPSPSLEYFISGAHWLDAVTPPLEKHLQHLVETVRLLLSRISRSEDLAREPAAPRQMPPEVGPDRALGVTAPEDAPLTAPSPRIAPGKGSLAARTVASCTARLFVLPATLAMAAFRRRPTALRTTPRALLAVAAALGAGGIAAAVLLLLFVFGGRGPDGESSSQGAGEVAVAPITPAPTATLEPLVVTTGSFPGLNGESIVATLEIGSPTRRDEVLRVDFRIRYTGETPDCAGSWQSDLAWHLRSIAEGGRGIGLESETGRFFPLVAAGGVASTDRVLRCGEWASGWWEFEVPVDVGRLSLYHPSVKSIELPGEP